MKSLYFKTSQEWRTWLKSNHDKETELWLIFYKNNIRPTLDYESAVEEALCFGWIDSIIKKIDEKRFIRKFTPRKIRSKWSPSNKKRVERLIKSGRMTNVGLLKIKAAQKNGCWDEPYNKPTINFEPPEDFVKALNNNRKAKEFFAQLAPTLQKQFIGWIRVAKRQETIEKRISESLKLLEKGEKLGLR